MSRPYVETTLTCCVCGTRGAYAWRRAGDHILGGPREFHAVKCARCGTVRLDPRPTPEEMNRHYTPLTYARAEGDETSGLAERLDEYNRRLAERAVAGTSDVVPKRALDVGCGDGRFLAQVAAQGWAVEGLETDPVAADLARKRTGGTIHEAPLETVELPEGAFGLVSILHVLEHVPEPRETLAAAWRALAPGGTLLVAVPNVGCLEASLFRSCWYPLDLPRHYWGFAPRTLSRLVETCGFAVQGIKHFPFLFGPQSVRYGFKAISGKPIGEEEGSAGPRREGGSLRTKAFLGLLTASERLGREVPGEVMELMAVKCPLAPNNGGKA